MRSPSPSPSSSPSSLLCAVSLAAATAASWVPATARAQTAPAATGAPAPPSEAALAAGREHFDRGVGLARQQDYDAALAEFLRAYELSRRPTVLFNIAATYQSLHRYPEALDAVRAFLRDATSASAAQRAEAETARRELEALVARVQVRVEPAGATVTLDGHALATGDEPAVVGPGRHVVEASLDGYRAAREEIVIASGERREVRLALAREAAPSGEAASGRGASSSSSLSVAPPRAEPSRGRLAPAYFAVAAVGTGVLAIASVTCGVLTMQTNADFEARTRDDPEVPAIAARGRALAISADVLGGVAIAAGVTAIVLATQTRFAPRRPGTEVSLSAGPGGAFGLVARGRF